MTIPSLTMPVSIEHNLTIGRNMVKVSGTLDLERRTITAGAVLVDGSPLNLEIGVAIRRELEQMYQNYKLILQY